MIQDTSILSHQTLNKSAIQKKLIDLMASRQDLTDKEASVILLIAASTISGVRGPLVKEGTVQKACKRECGITGHLAIAWKLNTTPPKYHSIQHKLY